VLSYQHAYHAGNFADVVKHSVLAALVSALTAKPRPFCYLDTHAGEGRYDLESLAARRHAEHAEGVVRALAAPDPPPGAREYLAAVRSLEGNATRVRWYPGSPWLVRRLARPQDRVVACEIHPGAYRTLARTVRGLPGVAVHRRDGYEALGALLPPPERRGLVLIDPSYETRDEVGRILAAVEPARRRFPGGVYAIWYPLRARRPVAALLGGLARLDPVDLVRLELRRAPPAHPADRPGLEGCGMAVINAPWQLEQTLALLGAWLGRVIAPGGECRVIPRAG
jgi:23S rRNA (adenine2030-N6)-methyltransferase